MVAFAHDFGSKGVRVGVCTNSQTGEQFPAVAFTASDNTRTFVSFSRKLGPLSPKEIAQQKNDLQVVLCETKEGRDMYSLCKQGEGAWGEEVEL